MTDPTDREYFTSRAADCRARAEAATHPDIAAVHRELAASYDKLIAMLPDRPRGRFSEEELLAAERPNERP